MGLGLVNIVYIPGRYIVAVYNRRDCRPIGVYNNIIANNIDRLCGYTSCIYEYRKIKHTTFLRDYYNIYRT